MLIDNITIHIKAGDGGDGSLHFLRNGQTAKGGPDGGNGGRGGSIYLMGSHNITDLREFRFKKSIVAESGTNGSGKKMHGKKADYTTILLPIGTRVTDLATNEVIEITDSETPIRIAKGGRGGLGNDEFKSAGNRTPMEWEPGEPGEEKDLLLELRMIAQIGLVGLPNAGKSSLLAMLTAAEPKIAAYPFTTLEPNIGMMGNYAIADIPGLIEGASDGKGLGVDFLRHIEKTEILLHLVSMESASPMDDYTAIREEFKKFNPELLEKQEIILLTKTDLSTPEVVKRTVKLFEKHGKKVLTCSIFDEASLAALKNMLSSLHG